MLQIATPLPADIPLCATGHRTQLVETRGAPRGRIAGAIVPSVAANISTIFSKVNSVVSGAAAQG